MKTLHHRSTIAVALSATLAAIVLSACGGGDDGAAPAGGASALSFSAATPTSHNTTADPGTAASKGNDARAADSFSSLPYCDVYYEDFSAANGKRYALQVYFRQGDKQPLNVSVVEVTPAAPALWVAFNNNSGNPITGVTVDSTARTIVFNSKALNDPTTGGAATLSGTVSFQANAAVPACGT